MFFFSKKSLVSFLPNYCHSFHITVILSRLLSFLSYYCHSFCISVIPSEYCHSFRIIAIQNICHPVPSYSDLLRESKTSKLMVSFHVMSRVYSNQARKSWHIFYKLQFELCVLFYIYYLLIQSFGIYIIKAGVCLFVCLSTLQCPANQSSSFEAIGQPRVPMAFL